MNEALELAIKTEKDGIEFYSKAADNSKDELGKKMFLAIIEDEKRHLEILQKISCEEYVCIEDIEGYEPRKALKTIFDNVPKGIREKTEDVSSDIEALELAMDMERLGYKQYKEAAAMATDPEQKKIFERLAYEEDEHYKILDEAKSYLEDTGNWFMWREYSFPT